MKEFGKRFEPGSGGFSRYGCFSFPGRGCFFVPHVFFSSSCFSFFVFVCLSFGVPPSVAAVVLVVHGWWQIGGSPCGSDLSRHWCPRMFLFRFLFFSVFFVFF